MRKLERSVFESYVYDDIDDYWFERINTIFNVFTEMTDDELAEIWLNDSLCVMEDLYESACKVKSEKKEREYFKKRVVEYGKEIDAFESKNEELSTQLKQYRAFVEDIRNASKTEPLCFCNGDVCVRDIFTRYGF